MVCIAAGIGRVRRTVTSKRIVILSRGHCPNLIKSVISKTPQLSLHLISVLAKRHFKEVGEYQSQHSKRLAMMPPSYISQQFSTLFLPQAVGWLLSFKFPIASSPLLARQAIVRPPTKRVLGLSLLVILLCHLVHAQSTASIEGQVTDQNGAILRAVEITAVSPTMGIARVGATDDDGRYQIAALPVGSYRIEVRAAGFQTQIIESSTLEVGRTVTQNFQLQVGEVSQSVTVSTANNLVEHSNVSIDHVVDQRMVQETPLNGRNFLDLALRVPGSVTPPQGAFSGSPMRGVGSLAINTGGNREEMVNYMVNGITLNNLTFSTISFQPSINTIQEFKVDNSTFSAEYGQSAGAIVNLATRSGTNEFHGEVFEFFRNDVLDARNFFEFTSHRPAPFKRNQFGGNLGGPIIKKKVFFLFSYEGLRQRQGLNVNSLVPSDAQRASVTDPVIARLINLIPRANFVDSSGTPRFVGSASAPVNVDTWTADINYVLSERDRLHGYYAIQDAEWREPTRSGNTIPGFGNLTRPLRQIFTLNETHIFSPNLVSEARLGFNRFTSSSTPIAQLNPADFGILNGISQPIGLPQINVAGGALNFGGPCSPTVRTRRHSLCRS